jgi:hypothetical protein
VLGYADNFNMYGNGTVASPDQVLTDYVLNTKPIETDFLHPVNPGNAAGYMSPTDPPNGNQGRGLNIGKSLYFDPEDPRREIFLYGSAGTAGVLNPSASTTGFNPLDCKWTAPGTPQSPGSGCLPFFMTFNPTDPNLPLDTSWYPGTGDPQMPVTGDKSIFGDLGNDYIVGGMGRVRVYGGWGFSLIDLRASTQENGGLNDGPVPNLVTANGKLVKDANGNYVLATLANSVYGTPAWEALAYGGAGQDIYFAGTGGDRLIDWVGNHNSYYVPFSPFGMPTVSRTLMPFLMEFLYALSKSDGADQTLGLRTDAFCASAAAGLNPACSDYPRYSGTAARNGEPFGELGLVLQHDAAWHQQTGPPFNEMPENLGGTAIDVMKTANVRPFASSGTCDYVNASSACTAAANLSLPNGAGVNLPSGTNTPGASAVPFLLTGAPGATVTYTFAEGTTYRVTGSGVIGPTGAFGGTVDVSLFPDGTITVTMVETGGGAPSKTISGSLGKSSLAPPPPTLSAAAYANLATQSTYSVTVTGQAGSIANVTITDSRTPVAELSNGMDFVGSNGSVVVPVDVTALLDGTLTISVTLTNGSGNSGATTLTVTKDATPPQLTMTVPPSINSQNVGNFPISLTGEKLDPLTYSITDGKTTVSGSSKVAGDGTWVMSLSLTSLKDGPVTITITETDPAGNNTVFTKTLTKSTVGPATPTVALSPASDSGVSNSDYVTNVNTPVFTVTSAAGTTTVVYVNGVAFTSGQKLTDGNYTVTAVSTDASGNVSATGTAPKTLVIVTTPPSGSFTVAGATTVNGVLTTNNKTPTLTLSFTDPGGISTMAVSTDGGSTYSATQAYASSVTVSLANGDGLYTIAIKLTDVAGNAGTYTQTVRLITSPTVSISPTTVTKAGSTSNQTVTFTVTLSASSPNSVTVAVKSVNGTAVAGTDFQGVSTTLTFAPGTTSQTVSVTIIGRPIGKVTKSFTVVLSSPTNAALGTTTSTVTITGTSAQVAAGVAPAGSVAMPLTASQLQPVIAAAEQDWQSVGIAASQLAADQFIITQQLPVGEIGYTDGNTIYIDATAAGFGWYTGLTGAFDSSGQALLGSLAAGHIDLLTVLLHEIGHTVGLPDGCACGPYTDLMQATLGAGERRSLSSDTSGSVSSGSSTSAVEGSSVVAGVSAPSLRVVGTPAGSSSSETTLVSGSGSSTDLAALTAGPDRRRRCPPSPPLRRPRTARRRSRAPIRRPAIRRRCRAVVAVPPPGRC